MPIAPDIFFVKSRVDGVGLGAFLGEAVKLQFIGDGDCVKIEELLAHPTPDRQRCQTLVANAVE